MWSPEQTNESARVAIVVLAKDPAVANVFHDWPVPVTKLAAVGRDRCELQTAELVKARYAQVGGGAVSAVTDNAHAYNVTAMAPHFAADGHYGATGIHGVFYHQHLMAA